MPGAQSVDEVADAIVDAIETPRAEIYTRPEMRALPRSRDVAEVEGQPPFTR